MKTCDGNLVFKDGAQFTYDTSKGIGAGSTVNTTLFECGRTITVTGTGTVVTEKNSANIGSVDGTTLNVEMGGKFVSSGSFINAVYGDNTEATINVIGDGFAVTGGLRVGRGYTALNV